MVLALAWLSAVAGCSRGGSSKAGRSSSVAGTLPAGVVGVSPAGVTTRVDAPAESTEEEYYQAHAARLWMDAQPGSGESLIEPYLAVVQASPSGVAGSWHIRWAALTPARQAPVVAARAAATRNADNARQLRSGVQETSGRIPIRAPRRAE
ncbi:lipoprotein [Mycobacterium tuberculosis CAS/NITR204]|uniref:Lipoprotein n=1 Tax=Mycobacterium tuberculosis CAS/NITR204 TaxID=1310114 RepID=R4MF46_MYCTX|nr:lipoprotein [Mycobacterium tuberculosis CAS/NITR204]